MKLTNKQQECFDNIMHFILNGKEQCYVFSGVAGSGKTTIIKDIDKHLNILGYRAANLALTGKATSVMRQKGITHASTIHAFLYEPIWDKEHNEFLGFKKIKKRELQERADYIIIDESSMVNSVLFQDLLDTEMPLLFVGDSEQLPCIDSRFPDFNIMNEADIHLSEIHRQAEGNPIIKLSRHIRETGRFDKRLGSENGVRFINKHEVNKQLLHSIIPDITICGTNRKRESLNRLARASYGFHEDYADVGEKVICLRNDSCDSSIMYNGEIYKVESRTPYPSKKEALYVLVNSSTMDKITARIENDSWHGEEPNRNSEFNFFAFGNAITVHKSQGSEFNKVLFVDEDVSYFIDQRRFRYTAITRAIKNITIAI